jgi:hypothetical protein
MARSPRSRPVPETVEQLFRRLLRQDAHETSSVAQRRRQRERQRDLDDVGKDSSKAFSERHRG